MDINGFKYIISGRNFRVNDYITIYTPDLEEIELFGEDEYWYLLHLLTRKPYDIAVELDDQGIDYQRIDEYDLFYMIANKIPVEQSCILLGKLNLTEYIQTENQENGQLILYNPKDGTVIDRAIYYQMLKYLRYVHFSATKLSMMSETEWQKDFFWIECEERKRSG